MAHPFIILVLIGWLLLTTVPAADMADSNDTSKLDPISAECVACHDGSEGMHINFCFLNEKGTGCGGHIVSASYPDLASRNEDLHDPDNLHPQMILHDGMITCVTCHGGEPHEGMPLAIDNSYSALCRACHVR